MRHESLAGTATAATRESEVRRSFDYRAMPTATSREDIRRAACSTRDRPGREGSGSWHRRYWGEVGRWLPGKTASRESVGPGSNPRRAGGTERSVFAAT